MNGVIYVCKKCDRDFPCFFVETDYGAEKPPKWCPYTDGGEARWKVVKI